MAKKLDILGKKFNRLLVLQEVEERDKHGKVLWECLCDCGKEVSVNGSSLVSGNTKSCGCYQKEIASNIKFKHGGSHSPEYRVWATMKERCNNSNSAQYKDYGGRGITYCQDWEDFSNFLRDMGPRPSDKHTIERVDVNGDYRKENCIWTESRSLQSYNRTKREDNTSGRTGVFWHKPSRKWTSIIVKDKKRFNLGSYDSFDDAVKAREDAEISYYGFLRD